MTENRFIQNKTVSNNNDIARETVQAVFDMACSVLIGVNVGVNVPSGMVDCGTNFHGLILLDYVTLIVVT
ncbi:hypothetical protein T03_11126 [Trichinella britovi]|uniref:Uncharacterized protein n=1 Tax=Trichinella britovi TaxID=45882 RepID=A0A0V1CEE7_TRIBR|nr:hypothetical protein T03_11126 [Trichinella britovi]